MLHSRSNNVRIATALPAAAGSATRYPLTTPQLPLISLIPNHFHRPQPGGALHTTANRRALALLRISLHAHPGCTMMPQIYKLSR